MTGLLGTGPEQCRSARPRVKSSGPRRVPPEPSSRRNRCYRHPIACPTERLPARQRMDRMSLAVRGPGTTGRALRASLRLVPLLLQGHTERDDEGRG